MEAPLVVVVVAAEEVGRGSSLKDPTEARTHLIKSIASEPRGRIPLADVFPATLRTRQNGAEDQMEQGLCATLVDSVSFRAFLALFFAFLFFFFLFYFFFFFFFFFYLLFVSWSRTISVFSRDPTHAPTFNHN
jgi:hypothetical protein